MNISRICNITLQENLSQTRSTNQQLFRPRYLRRREPDGERDRLLAVAGGDGAGAEGRRAHRARRHRGRRHLLAVLLRPRPGRVLLRRGQRGGRVDRAVIRSDGMTSCPNDMIDSARWY